MQNSRINSGLKKMLAVLPLIAVFAVFPLSVSAHYVYSNSVNLATVAADGHDHVHAEEEVAHGPGDGHTDHSHSGGASALLKAGEPAWWGLLFVSLLFTGGLSYVMWKFLQIPKKSSVASPQSSVKFEEKK